VNYTDRLPYLTILLAYIVYMADIINDINVWPYDYNGNVDIFCKAKDGICNPLVVSVFLSVCLSVIGMHEMRGQRAYRPRRLGALVASCSAATRHAL